MVRGIYVPPEDDRFQLASAELASAELPSAELPSAVSVSQFLPS